MRLRILVTRPREDGEEIARRLAAMGHQALLAPLLSVKFLDGAAPDLAGIQAMLATSANGVRALARRTPNRDVPRFSRWVRRAPPRRARRDFSVYRVPTGDAAALAQAVARWADPRAGILLHAAGEEASGALCERLTALGFQTRREMLYRMEKAAPVAAASRGCDPPRRGGCGAVLFAQKRCACSPNAPCAMALPTDRLIAICISAGHRRRSWTY